MMKHGKVMGIGLILMVVVLFGFAVGLRNDHDDGQAHIWAEYAENEQLYHSDEVQVFVDSWDEYLTAQASNALGRAYISELKAQYCLDDSYDLVPLMVIAQEQNDDFTVLYSGKVLAAVQEGKPFAFVPDSECGAFSTSDKDHWDWKDMYTDGAVLDDRCYNIAVRGLCERNVAGFYQRTDAHSHSEQIRIKDLATVKAIPHDHSGLF